MPLAQNSLTWILKARQPSLKVIANGVAGITAALKGKFSSIFHLKFID